MVHLLSSTTELTGRINQDQFVTARRAEERHGVIGDLARLLNDARLRMNLPNDGLHGTRLALVQSGKNMVKLL
jgi:hypothetical protein